MATKIQNTPTTNIFSVLADENPHQAQPKKQSDSTPASTSATEKIQSTPAARAASKALQEKRKEEAEKAKKPSASDADVKPEDLEGFSKQRGQRQKDKRQTPQEPPKDTNKNFNKDKKFNNNKNKNTKNNGDDATNGNNNTNNNNANNVSNNNTNNKPYNKVKGPGGPGYKNDKPYNHPSRDRDANAPRQEVLAARPPKRDHDKQSQGQYPRKPIAKKQGHGTGNWGPNDDSEAIDDTVQTHEPTPSVVTDDDLWNIPPATSEAPLTESADTTAAPDQAATDVTQDDAAAKTDDLGLEDFERQRAEKAQELASKYGLKTRDYTDEERKNLEKFQKILKDKTPEFPLPGPKAYKEKEGAAPTPSNSRKGEKSVAVEDYFRIPPPARRGRGRQGEGRGGERGERGEGNKDSSANQSVAGQAQQQNQNQAPNTSENKPRGGKGPGGRGGKPQGQSQRKFDVKNNHQFPSLG